MGVSHSFVHPLESKSGNGKELRRPLVFGAAVRSSAKNLAKNLARKKSRNAIESRQGMPAQRKHAAIFDWIV